MIHQKILIITKKGLNNVKKILKAKIYRDIENDLFKSKIISKSNDKKELISALAIITNDILIKNDVPLSTYIKFLKEAEIYCELFKEDLL